MPAFGRRLADRGVCRSREEGVDGGLRIGLAIVGRIKVSVDDGAGIGDQRLDFLHRLHGKRGGKVFDPRRHFACGAQAALFFANGRVERGDHIAQRPADRWRGGVKRLDRQALFLEAGGLEMVFVAQQLVLVRSFYVP